MHVSCDLDRAAMRARGSSPSPREHPVRRTEDQMLRQREGSSGSTVPTRPNPAKEHMTERTTMLNCKSEVYRMRISLIGDGAEATWFLCRVFA